MIKILRYMDRKFDKRSGFSRSESDEEDIKEKGIKKSTNRIFAEDELDELLSDGWKIIGMSTSQFVTGIVGSTTSFEKMTVIIQKDDE